MIKYRLNIRIKNYYLLKDIICGKNKQETSENICTYIRDKRLISIIYKETLYIEKKKRTEQTKCTGKQSKEQEIQMIIKCVKGCSTTLVDKKMQIKLALYDLWQNIARTHLYPDRCLTSEPSYL